MGKTWPNLAQPERRNNPIEGRGPISWRLPRSRSEGEVRGRRRGERGRQVTGKGYLMSVSDPRRSHTVRARGCRANRPERRSATSISASTVRAPSTSTTARARRRATSRARRLSRRAAATRSRQASACHSRSARNRSRACAPSSMRCYRTPLCRARSPAASFSTRVDSPPGNRPANPSRPKSSVSSRRSLRT